MDLSAKGMRVLVTAGGAGIGRVIADTFVAQGAKVHVRRVVILIERESVISIEPAKINVAAFFRFANGDHRWVLSSSATMCV